MNFNLFKLKFFKFIDLISVYKQYNKDVVFITEQANWVINDIIKNLESYLINNTRIKVTIKYSDSFLKNKIIHYGSIHTFLSSLNKKTLNKSNKIIVTCFHITETLKKIQNIKQIIEAIDIIHTSCNKTKKELQKIGFSNNQIKVIPLGVDIKLFSTLKHKRHLIRKQYGIPKNSFCIGSFQKDGNGWEQGLQPKLIKGPDIFCDVVEKLSERNNIFVLLSGPARGYVKNRLKKANISFNHQFFKNPKDISKLYSALDLYLITSRVEGGPLALLEAAAAKVPIVSTKVGMATDIFESEKEALLCEIENIDEICYATEKIIKNLILKENLITNASNKISSFSWNTIFNDYYHQLYKSYKNHLNQT